MAAVGYFGTFIYRDGQWQQRSGASPELVVDVHDSDIATIDYRPAPAGLGRFYLGHQPRNYFGDPEASRPVDVPAEVEAFRGWATDTLGRAPREEDIRPLLAERDGQQPADDAVEDTVVRLLDLLGVPVPEGFAAAD
ncbi:hypothetical protein SAMN05661080_01030 [Modestobacter sp. DSM 44400]|nr:hypothetical protein SAMN05661080_01030 [Modestobacter sp. DSM 44400]